MIRRVDLLKIAYDFEYELDHWKVDPHVYQELVTWCRNGSDGPVRATDHFSITPSPWTISRYTWSGP